MRSAFSVLMSIGLRALFCLAQDGKAPDPQRQVMTPQHNYVPVHA